MVAWGAVQAFAAGLFPFTRLRLLVALMAVGTVTPGLVLVIFGVIEGTGFDAVLLALWTVCYAAYAALFSTALPAGRAAIRFP